MRLRSPKVATTAFVAVLVSLAGILAFTARHRSTARRDAAPAAAPASAARLAAHQDSAAIAKRSAWLPIHQILPQLSGPVADWRTWNPDTITVAPYSGYKLPFHRVSVTEKNGITTWIGRNGMQGTFLVGIGKKDSWVGCLVTMGSTFGIHVLNGAVRVTEHSGSISCGVRPTPVEFAAASSTATAASFETHYQPLVASVAQNEFGTGVADQINGQPAPSGTTIYTVPVAFFYTSNTVNYEVAAGNVTATSQVSSYMDSLYRSYLVAGNLIAQQSGVHDLNWICVGVYQAPDYTRTPVSSITDLKGVTHITYDINRDLGAFETTAGDTPTAFATYATQTIRDTSAEQWQLIEPYTDTYGGLAGDPGHDSVVECEGGATTTLHELGHNFGLQHDRANAPKAVDGDGLYWYGYKFAYNAKSYGGPDYQYNPGDIMSYGGPILPYYANPNISFTGNELGVGSVSDNNHYALGVPTDQSKAAYAALYLSQHVAALALATYNETLTAAGWTGLNGWLSGGDLMDPNQATKVAPSFAVLPVTEQTVGAGRSIHLAAAAASGTSVTYQWRKNGVEIAGATSATLDIANATSADNGVYDLAITNDVATVISRGASVNVVSAQAYSALSSKLFAISTRSLVSGTDSGVQDAGFIITGSTPKTVLIRASGPALIPYGVSGTLADPVLTVYDGKSQPIATNDDWDSDPTSGAAIAAAAKQVGDFPWAAGSKDSAVLLPLNPGAYTAIVKDKNGGSGVAMVEVYEVTSTGGKFVGISTRSPVGTGSAVQVAGFIITGNAPKTVLIRASGPALIPYGVAGTLPNPVLTLYDASAQVIATNDDWYSDPSSGAAIAAAAAQVGEFAWTVGSKDAAILITLNPGLYTAQVSSGDASTGVALVEVYDASK